MRRVVQIKKIIEISPLWRVTAQDLNREMALGLHRELTLFFSEHHGIAGKFVDSRVFKKLFNRDWVVQVVVNDPIVANIVAVKMG